MGVGVGAGGARTRRWVDPVQAFQHSPREQAPESGLGNLVAQRAWRAFAAMSVASASTAASTARRLTADRRQEIRDAFNLFDVDGVGLIPVSELEYALKALGVRTDATEIAAMLERIEARQEADAAAPAGMITFAAFLACAADQLVRVLQKSIP